MKIELYEEFDIPSATPQQRRMSKKGNYAGDGLKYARAAWQALLEKAKPESPLKGAVAFTVELRYHTGDRSKAMTYKTTRPDGTNLLKLIEDCATKAGWWTDDNQSQPSIMRLWTLGPSTVRIIAEEVE